MPSVDRDDSRDRELVRHSHSFSSDGRPIVVPMYVLSLRFARINTIANDAADMVC